MSKPGQFLEAFLEQDNVKQLMEDNDIEIRDMVGKFVPKFHQSIKSYVLENQNEFLADSLEQIYENVKLFAHECMLSAFHEMDTYYDKVES